MVFFKDVHPTACRRDGTGIIPLMVIVFAVISGVSIIGCISSDDSLAAAVGDTFVAENEGVSIEYMITDVVSNTVQVGIGNITSPAVGSSVTAVTIPGSVTHSDVVYTVTEIGGAAFYGRANLSSVAIPDSVSKIGGNAFEKCSGLVSVATPLNVDYIATSTFMDCTGLTSVTFTGSVTAIGSSAFEGCTALVSIGLPGVLTSISSSAFQNCTGLTSIHIPSSVSTIGSYAFKGCTSLASIEVDEGNPYYKDIEGVLFTRFNELVAYPDGHGSEYNVPESTASINNNAFYGCVNLVSVTIPATVTTIGVYSFTDCTSLVFITLPGAISIGYSSFMGCTSLASIDIPSGVETIPSSLFKGCTSLTSVSISSATRIDSEAFYGCKELASIALPSGLTDIGSKAFMGCDSLTSISIPSSVSNIGLQAFTGCESLAAFDVDAGNSKYASVDGVLFDKAIERLIHFPGGRSGSYSVPDTVVTVGEYSFKDCTGLESISFGNGLKAIESSAFTDCTGLESISLPESLETMKTYAFQGCIRIGSIIIPASVGTIGNFAFIDCSGLASIDVDPENANYASVDGVLFDKAIEKLIHFPGGRSGLYSVPDTVLAISDNAFRGCSGITSVYIPSSVTNITTHAFSFCLKLESIVVDPGNVYYSSPDGVLYKGSKLIAYPSARFGEYDIPSTVTSVSTLAFDGACITDDSVMEKGGTVNVIHHDFTADYAFSDDSTKCLITLKCAHDEMHAYNVLVDTVIGDGKAVATFEYGGEAFTRSVPYDDGSDEDSDGGNAALYIGIGAAVIVAIAAGAVFYLRRR